MYENMRGQIMSPIKKDLLINTDLSVNEYVDRQNFQNVNS